MPAPVELLRKVPLFACLGDEDLSALAARCEQRICTEGSPVVSAGSRGSAFFVIADGEATVAVRGEQVGRLRRGDCFGELALIDGGRRTADITAVTNMTCWGLSQRQFRAYVLEHPELAWALLEQTVARLRETQARGPAPRPRARGRGWGRSRRG